MFERLPELFEKARAFLAWCFILEGEELGGLTIVNNLALSSINVDVDGPCLLSFLLRDGGLFYSEPESIFVTLGPDGTMSRGVY